MCDVPSLLTGFPSSLGWKHYPIVVGWEGASKREKAARLHWEKWENKTYCQTSKGEQRENISWIAHRVNAVEAKESSAVVVVTEMCDFVCVCQCGVGVVVGLRGKVGQLVLCAGLTELNLFIEITKYVNFELIKNCIEMI